MAQIRSIQVLRAVAALAVTFGHLEHEAASLPAATASGFTPVLLDLSGAGVDLFFVISGFVMVHASHDLFGQAQAPRVFLLRRIARIVPLYWLVTTLFLLTMAVAHVLSSAPPTFDEIVKSYLFIPYASSGAEAMQPVFKLGWTLNYEMFFYGIFAAMLVLPARAALVAITGLFGTFVGLGLWLKPGLGLMAFWSHPIILEFVFGALIARVNRDGRRLTSAQAALLVLAGLCGFAATAWFGVVAHGAWRPLVWGVPAALIFMAAALHSANEPLRRGGWLVAWGDASYAIYLLHPLAVRTLRIGFDKAHPSGRAAPWLFVALGLVVVVPAAVAVHRWIERPLTRMLTRLFGVRPTHLEPSHRSAGPGGALPTLKKAA